MTFGVRSSERQTSRIRRPEWPAPSLPWWETRAGAEAKVNKSAVDGLPELALFRLLPDAGGDATKDWPLEFWWDALEAFRPQA